MPNIDLGWLYGMMKEKDMQNTFSNPVYGAQSPGDVDPYINSPENMKRLKNKTPIQPEDAMAKYGVDSPFAGGNYANQQNLKFLFDKYQQDNQYSTQDKYTQQAEQRHQAAAIAEEQRQLANAGRTAIGLVPVLASKLGIPATELYSQLGTDYTQAGRNNQYLYGSNLAQGALQGQSGALSNTYRNVNSMNAERGAAPYAMPTADAQAAMTLRNLQNPSFQDAYQRGQIATAEAPVFNNYAKTGMQIGQGQTGYQPAYQNLPAYNMQGAQNYSEQIPTTLRVGNNVLPGKPITRHVNIPGSISPVIPAEEIENIPVTAVAPVPNTISGNFAPKPQMTLDMIKRLQDYSNDLPPNIASVILRQYGIR